MSESTHVELPARLLDYFLRCDKSNLNQKCLTTVMWKPSRTRVVIGRVESKPTWAWLGVVRRPVYMRISPKSVVTIDFESQLWPNKIWKSSAEVPKKAGVKSSRLLFPDLRADRLETWLIPSGTTRSKRHHESTMVWRNLWYDATCSCTKWPPLQVLTSALSFRILVTAYLIDWCCFYYFVRNVTIPLH